MRLPSHLKCPLIVARWCHIHVTVLSNVVAALSRWVRPKCVFSTHWEQVGGARGGGIQGSCQGGMDGQSEDSSLLLGISKWLQPSRDLRLDPLRGQHLSNQQVIWLDPIHALLVVLKGLLHVSLFSIDLLHVDLRGRLLIHPPSTRCISLISILVVMAS